MNKNLSEIQQLTLDIMGNTVPNKFNGKDFGTKQAEDLIRNVIIETCEGKFDFYTYQKNKWDVFQIISEVLTAPMGNSVEGLYGDLVEVHDTAMGDTKEFDIEDNSLFRVALVSSGNQDIRRQDIYSRKLPVDTDRYGIKIYTELELFLSGRINFSNMIERIQRSFDNHVASLVNTTMYDAYTKDASLISPYKASGAVTDTGLITIIQHVEAATGQKVAIMGTAIALSKIPNTEKSEIAKREREILGYEKTFRNRPLVEMPQVHKSGTDEFAVKDDFLLIIPVGEKPVKVLFEGDAQVYDINSEERNDEQIEMFFGRKVGVAVITASKYGYWRM